MEWTCTFAVLVKCKAATRVLTQPTSRRRMMSATVPRMYNWKSFPSKLDVESMTNTTSAFLRHSTGLGSVTNLTTCLLTANRAADTARYVPLGRHLVLYDLEACSLTKSNLQFMDLMIKRFLMKLLKTNNIDHVKYCQHAPFFFRYAEWSMAETS